MKEDLIKKDFLQGRILFVLKASGREDEMRKRLKEQTSLSDKKIKMFLQKGITTERDARKFLRFYYLYNTAALYLKREAMLNGQCKYCKA